MVKEHSSVFNTRLLVINMLVNSINAGLSDFVFATGKIKTYQIATNTLVVLSVIVGYFALEQGLRPEYLFYIYILFSLLVTIARPFIIKRISTFKIRSLIIESYIPAISVTVICCPLLFLKVYLSPWVLIFISYLYIAISIYYIALKSNERKYIVDNIKKILKKYI